MTETSVWAILGLTVFISVLLWIMSPAGRFDGWSIRQWFRRGSSKRFSDALESTLDSILDAKAKEWQSELQGLCDLDEVRAEKRRLEDQVATLTQDMDTARREIERERKEIEFDLGLEKQRREQEHEFATTKLDQAEKRLEAEKAVAIREASVKAREEALQVVGEQNRAFLEKQAELIETLTDALPKAEILARIGNGS